MEAEVALWVKLKVKHCLQCRSLGLRRWRHIIISNLLRLGWRRSLGQLELSLLARSVIEQNAHNPRIDRTILAILMILTFEMISHHPE